MYDILWDKYEYLLIIRYNYFIYFIINRVSDVNQDLNQRKYSVQTFHFIQYYYIFVLTFIRFRSRH